MIEIKNVAKRFDTFAALNDISLNIDSGVVYGLLGTNGAGKSTLLRIISGVIKADEGSVSIDSEEVYDNPGAKMKLFFVADDEYFFSYSTGEDMAKYYSCIYEKYDMDYFYELTKMLSLDPKRKLVTFSKGMKKQMAIIIGICAKTEILLCDETFDGLDPVMRQAMKSLFAKEMSERVFTPVITSHNLRELEDICDIVGILHKGGVLLSKDLDTLKCNIQKIQCVFKEEDGVSKAKESLNIVKLENRGSMYTITVRGSRDEVEEKMAAIPTIFSEMLPLTLEEIFISETEVVGYDIKKLFLED